MSYSASVPSRSRGSGPLGKRGRLPLPEWYCFALVPIGDVVFAFGGVTEGRWTNEAFCYRPAADTWQPASWRPPNGSRITGTAPPLARLCNCQT